jgi:deaminated glutathione amidase
MLRRPSTSAVRIFNTDLIVRRLIACMSTEATKNVAAVSLRGKHKIAICQMTCKASKSENFEICQQLIVDAHKQGAQMVFLPEACDYIESSVQASVAKGESLEGHFISGYRELAARLSLWISIGSFHRHNSDSSADTSKLYNSHVVLDDKGDIRCVSDKIHLFELNLNTGDKPATLKESDYTFFGKQFHMPIRTPIGLLGTSIVMKKSNYSRKKS